MARSFGKILTSIWRNKEFCALNSDAKVLFFHLISRDDVTFAGRLVIRERVWCREAFNGDTVAFQGALAELVTGRYVILDLDHEEALVRTYIRHDEAYKHAKWIKSVRVAIEAIDSPILREIAAGELQRLEDDPNGDDPGTQTVPNPLATDTQNGTPPVDNPSPLVVPNALANGTQPVGNAPNTHYAVDNVEKSVVNAPEPVPKLTLVPRQPPDDDDRIIEAIELHALHESAGKRKPKGYAQTIRENDPVERGGELRAYLERHPDATPAELAHKVLNVPTSEPLPDRRPAKPDWPHCDDCDDQGWVTVWPDNGGPSTTVERCHCPQGQSLKGTA